MLSWFVLFEVNLGTKKHRALYVSIQCPVLEIWFSPIRRLCFGRFVLWIGQRFVGDVLQEFAHEFGGCFKAFEGLVRA